MTSVTSAVTPSATSPLLRQLSSAYASETAATAHRAAKAYFSALPTLEIASVVLTALCAAGVIAIIIKTGWVRARRERFENVVLKTNHAKRFVKKSWSEVERHFFSGSDSDLKIAILKADTLLGDALREAGIRGADLGERLRGIGEADLPNIDRVWEAHKLRNRIAHEADYVLKRDLAERALTVYEEALAHLGVLEEAPATSPAPDSNSPSNLPPSSSPR